MLDNNIPDPILPRRSYNGGSSSRKAAATVELIPQPKPVNYNTPNTPKQRWVGYVLDWNDKNHFGKIIPGPHRVKLECYAVDRAHAEVVLDMMAKANGWALMGVQDIHAESFGEGGDDDV